MTTLRALILAAADAVEAALDELGRLDSVAGDGDHGTTTTIGARAVRKRLEVAVDASDQDLLKEAALATGSVGGAIGPIYATGILRIASTPHSQPATVTDLRAAAEAAEVAIMDLGQAKPGDKTVLDALHPLVESLRRSEADGADLTAAILAAAQAARAGADSTRDMIASVGRASRLGERSRGSPDPGATSFAIIVEAMVGAFVGHPVADA